MFDPQAPSDERGSVFLELGVILPILLAIFIGTFEFGLYLQKKERNASLSRQVGNLAFRQCLVPPPSQVNMTTCLQGVRDEFNDYLTQAAINAEMRITAYELQPDNFVYWMDSAANGTTYVSHYPGPSIPTDLATFQANYVSAIIPTNPRIIIVEVFEEYERFYSSFSGFLQDQTLYHVAIF